MMTFVVTTFHRPDFLVACLASVPPEADVIVIDDAVRHEGYAYARLRGLRQVDTEFVAFLDDDDVLMPNWLPLHLAAMGGHDVVAGSYLETDADLVPLRTHRLPAATLADFERLHCPVNDGALIRSQVLERITWHPERATAMMFSAWSDLIRAGARFTSVTVPTWYHRLHDGNMSATVDDLPTRAMAFA